MTKLTIYTDLKISKQRRRHVVATDDNLIERWHESVTGALETVLDLGHTVCTIEDEGGKYEVQIVKVDAGG